MILATKRTKIDAADLGLATHNPIWTVSTNIFLIWTGINFIFTHFREVTFSPARSLIYLRSHFETPLQGNTYRNYKLLYDQGAYST